MPRANHQFAWSLSLATLLLTIPLLSSSCVAQETPKHIVLPNPKLIGCKTSTCSQLVSEDSADPNAIHPWQVLVDFNQGQVIGLIAFYDKPASFNDLRAALDERYGKWTASFSNDKMRSYRVEPEQFVISLSYADSGMIQVIYLMFDPKHPSVVQPTTSLWCSMAQAAAAHCARPQTPSH